RGHHRRQDGPERPGGARRHHGRQTTAVVGTRAPVSTVRPGPTGRPHARTSVRNRYGTPDDDVAQPSAGSSAAVRQPSGTSGAGVSPSTTTSSSVRSRRVASGMKAAYTAAPPMTHRSSGPTSPSASAGDATTVAPS